MAEDDRTLGRPIRRVQVERVELDLSNLNREQVEELRAKMKDMAAGSKDPRGDFGGIEPLASHSSHGDDDGWV